MTLARSVLLISAQPRESQVQTRNHAWCRPWSGAFPDTQCDWGDVQMMDPGNKGYDEPYRVDGVDATNLMVQRSYGPPTRNEDCPESDPWYPFCEEHKIGIFTIKGYMHKQNEGDFSHLNQGDYDFVADVFCKIYLDGKLASSSLPSFWHSLHRCRLCSRPENFSLGRIRSQHQQ